MTVQSRRIFFSDDPLHLLHQIQRDASAVLQPYFTSTGLVIKALEHASKMEHIMDFTRLRCLGSLFSMLHQACRNVALYNNNHPDFPMPIDQLEKYMQVMYCSLHPIQLEE